MSLMVCMAKSKLSKVAQDFVTTIIQAALDSGGVNPNDLKVMDGGGAVGGGTAINFTGAISTILQATCTLAIGLTLIYFLMDLNQKLVFEGQQLTLKTAFAPFIKLFASFGIMSRGARLVGAAGSLHNYFVGTANNWSNGLFSQTISNNNVNYDEFPNIGIIQMIVLILPLLLLLIVSWIVGLVWTYKTITYKIEWFFRLAYTPIAYCDIYSGTNSNWVKWTKGWISFALYGAALVFIPKLTNALFIADVMDDNSFLSKILGWNGIGGDALTGVSGVLQMIPSLIKAIIYPIAGLGAIGAVRSVTKEVVG